MVPGGATGVRPDRKEDGMDLVEKVLEERAEELAETVRAEAGLTAGEAHRLVEQATPDLVASFRWKAEGRESSSPRFRSPPGRAYLVRDLLDAMSGRAVAEKVGIPVNRGWDGLRALVPAVLDRLAERARAEAGSHGEAEGGSGEEQIDAGGGVDGRGVSDGLGMGVGLFLEGIEAPGRWRSGRGGDFGHPIFDYLPPGRSHPLG